jgi:hypothetical protein
LEQDWFAGHWDTRGEDYAFMPDQCLFDQWSPADLRLVSAAPAGPRRWVLVLGSSKDRGVYSRLIDLVLRPEEKDKFHHSVVQKCWGWLDVRIGRLRLTFADFRAQFYFSAGVTCNNEKVASSPQLHLDGIKFWSRLFREERYQPDAIWMVGDHIPQFPISHYGLYLRQAVTAGWTGVFLFAPTDVMPNVHPSWLPCSHNVTACGRRARDDVRALRAVHDNVVLIDMTPVLFSSVTVRGARLCAHRAHSTAWQDMEKHLDAHCYSCSNHYHYVCTGAADAQRARPAPPHSVQRLIDAFAAASSTRLHKLCITSFMDRALPPLRRPPRLQVARLQRLSCWHQQSGSTRSCALIARRIWCRSTSPLRRRPPATGRR